MEKLIAVSLVIFVAIAESSASGGGAYAVSNAIPIQESMTTTNVLTISTSDDFDQELSDVELEMLFN